MEVGVILCTDPEHLSTDKPKFFIDLDDDECCAAVAREELHAQGVAEDLGLVEGGFTILTKTGRTLAAKQEALKKVKSIVVVRDDGTLVLMLNVPAAEGKEPGAAAGAAGGGGVLAQAAQPIEGKEVCIGRRRVHRDPSTTEVLLHEGFPVTIEVTHETTAAAAREQMERDGVLAIPALKAGFKFLTKLGGLLTPHQEDTRMVYKLVDGDVLALHALAGAADGTN
jgi:hypothetical protein